jgi:hypothetical protein
MCGIDDALRKQVGICVSSAVGLPMHVVELPDCGDAREGHLKEGHAGYVEEFVRFQTGSCAIHSVTPCPEVIAICPAVFRDSANEPLKAMGVAVHQSRKKRLARHRNHIRKTIFRDWTDLKDHSLVVDQQTDATSKPGAAEE